MGHQGACRIGTRATLGVSRFAAPIVSRYVLTQPRSLHGPSVPRAGTVPAVRAIWQAEQELCHRWIYVVPDLADVGRWLLTTPSEKGSDRRSGSWKRSSSGDM
jgi:hypothetical protein